MKNRFLKDIILKYLSLTFIFVLSGLNLLGQRPTFVAFRGLYATLINDIVIDFNDKCVATEGGLAIISGKGSESIFLKDLAISCCFVDRYKRKWVGTYSGEIICINKNGKIDKRFSVSKELNLRDTTLVIGQIVGNNQYVFWALGPTNAVIRFTGDKELVSIPIKKRPKCLFVDHNDRLWAGTDDGLFVFDGEKKQFTLVSDKVGRVTSICEYNSSIFLSSIKGIKPRLYECVLTDGFKSVKRLPMPDSVGVANDFLISSNSTYFIASTKLWVKDSSDSWKSYGREYGIESSSLLHLALDLESILWIGTEGAGLYSFYFDSTGLADDTIEQVANLPIIEPTNKTLTTIDSLPSGIKVENCDNPVQSGGFQRSLFAMDLGVEKGKFKLWYDMMTYPDYLAIFCGGKKIFETTNENNQPAKVRYSKEEWIEFNCRVITILVEGGQKATKWKYQIGCPVSD